eukprot:1884435-Pyramimonas_sp.AAC.1
MFYIEHVYSHQGEDGVDRGAVHPLAEELNKNVDVLAANAAKLHPDLGYSESQGPFYFDHLNASID